MKLFEYESKKLFKEAGIPVIDGARVIHFAEEIVAHKLQFPLTIKTQVLSGGRGKAGGIKFAENVDEALAVAKEIFALQIKGEYPQMLLLEPKVKIKREYYVAITLDREQKCPIIMGSADGGMDIESSDSITLVPVKDGFYGAHLARKLAYKMGLSGKAFTQVAGIIDKLYKLYEKFDLDLAEINPLAELEDGTIVALDGKITINDDALGRQPRFAEGKIWHLSDRTEREKRAVMADVNLVDLGEGSIGILCNGAGLTMATMDLVKFAGGTPANFLDVGGGADKNRVNVALDLVLSNENVKVVLINILGGITACDQVAQPLMNFKERYPKHKLVVRLLGNNQDKAREMLKDKGIDFIDDLDKAVAKAVELSR